MGLNMTIRIIKQGKLPEEKVYRFTCYHCKTEFTAQEKDGNKTYNQHDGTSVTVSCPLCNHQVSSDCEYTESQQTFHKHPGNEHILPSFSEDPTI